MSEIRADKIHNVTGDNDSGIDLSTNDQVVIKTADTNRVLVDANGKVGIGATTIDSDIHIEKASDLQIKLERTGSGTSTISVPSSGQLEINNTSNAAMTLSANNTERMRITNDGYVLVGKTVAQFNTAGTQLYPNGEVNLVTASTTVPLYLRRLDSDGVFVHFNQGSSYEGNISVSGSTVSYNGGHLARYSRLANNTKDTSIVKGTVMTNLDEMVEWSHEEVLWTDEEQLPDGVSVGDVKESAYTEDNEQLNKMAVSSVEGDANVAGVFVNWDDSDDFNDMNVAMTGDMVIRIAQGTTVARGDLLMSAGDGTAKPQGDDIVRSKTIAKVTSTNVSHTYDDGTYLVPCVLMAC